ncbi:MAG: hypothetical protein K6T57_12155 [Thermaceae bacterium]|nr:hypothetical protein [Thermaceae bacterium]
MSQRSEFHPTSPPSTSAYTGPERRAQSPLQRLARQFDAACTGAVDSLQVAAALESGGITDRIARDEYGFPDVFSLAEELYRRVPRRLKPKMARDGSSGRWRTLRELSHGPLFVLPALAYPALSLTLGVWGLLVGLVLSTAVGWAWGLALSWLAYRQIGRGLREEAARLLARLSLLGVLVVAALALPLVHLLGVNPQVVFLATGQMAYQMAASVLLIYGLELWLLLGLLPGVLVNGWYLLVGLPQASRELALGATLSALFLVLMAAGNALAKTPRSSRYTPTLKPGDFRAALPFLLYGALSAALVLLGTARYMLSGLDRSLSLLPLILCMGVLEWQARRFREGSVEILRRTRQMSEFVLGERRVLLQTLGTALLAVGLASVAAGLGLAWLGQLTPEGVTMLTAHLALAGAFFINFLLLARGRTAWVLLSVGGGLLLYGSLIWLFPPALSYLLSTLALFGAVLWGLRVSLGEVAQYR